jgi:hypothetical protein
MRGNKKNKRLKNKINDLLELKLNDNKKVRSYNIYRGVSIEADHFSLIDQITIDQQLADNGILNL